MAMPEKIAQTSTCRYCGMPVRPGNTCGRTACVERLRREIGGAKDDAYNDFDKIEERFKRLSAMPKDSLKALVRADYRVVDVTEVGKASLVMMVMSAQYGERRLDAWREWRRGGKRRAQDADRRVRDARLRGEGPSRYAPPVDPNSIVKPLSAKPRTALCRECSEKPAAKGEHFCSKACEKAWITREFPEDAKRGFTLDRARMHRALDAALDMAKAADDFTSRYRSNVAAAKRLKAGLKSVKGSPELAQLRAEITMRRKALNAGKVPAKYVEEARQELEKLDAKLKDMNAKATDRLHRALDAALDMAAFKSARARDTENTYTPMYRPAHGSAFPAGVKWHYVEAPANEPLIAARLGIPLSRLPFGVISLSRRLTPEEREEYQMKMV